MIGKTLGHYRITKRIGAGGMGEVYLARDERLERDVAFKVLPSEILSDQAARKQFKKEALTLSKLNHPHIATVFDFDTQDGTDFLVMEYVPGETLAEKLQGGPLAEKEVARLGGQMAEALEEAHAHGVIHCDLKPGNVALTAKGDAKVLDFGIAKLLRSEKELAEAATLDALSKSASVAGTLFYMAPEQVRGEAVDARSDIYALGAVLYEMATGRRAFSEIHGPRLIDSILHESPPPPGRLKANLSSRLEDAILKSLEKDPENRYQSAKELAVDLRRLGTPTATTITSSPRAPAWGTALRQPLAVAAIAVLILVAGGLGFNIGGLRDQLLGTVASGQITSIVVLPLDNMMGDAEQDYFVEGMHEALITELSKISALTVISRTSAMRYKGVKKPIPEIARELGVNAVIEGSVLRAGNTVRVTAQLIDGRTDRHLWANSFDRELKDILALHSAVARAIAHEIKIAVTPEEETRLASTRPVNPEAHEAYLKGLYYGEKSTGQAMKKANEYFAEAIEQDPFYAQAYAGLASSYMGMGNSDLLPPNEVFPKAKTAAMRALVLDDTLAETHFALGWVKMNYERDWGAAGREFERAIELNPGHARSHYSYSYWLAAMGRFEEAVAEAKRARELDPLVLTMYRHVGRMLYFARNYDQAIEAFQRALELDPDYGPAHNYLGWVYLQKGMYEEAIVEIQKGAGEGPSASLAYVYAVMGRSAEAREILNELVELSKGRHVSKANLARVFGALGDRDQAFALLDQAYEEYDSWMFRLQDPVWDPLRDDPRFQDLLRRMNFPEAGATGPPV